MGGANSGRGGLPAEKVQRIQRRLKSGHGTTDIARDVGVAVSTVNRIKSSGHHSDRPKRLSANRFDNEAKFATDCIECHHTFRKFFDLYEYARFHVGAVGRRNEILQCTLNGRLKEAWVRNAQHARTVYETAHKRRLRPEILEAVAAANHQREQIWKFAGDSYIEDRSCFPTAHALSLHTINRVWHVLSHHDLLDAPPAFANSAKWPTIDGMVRQLGVFVNEEQVKVAIGNERRRAIDWLRAQKHNAAEIAGAKLTSLDLAKMFNLTDGATRKRLERWRADNPSPKAGWHEATERGRHDPHYLYRLEAVRHLFSE